jgi:hypothetical protein
MSLLFWRAYWKLIAFDPCFARGKFGELYSKVRNCPVAAKTRSGDPVRQVCWAIDSASIWYWREVLCLQRSAATTCLLRQAGVPAQMVIGVQQLPFKAHAWVEVGGRVVGDKPYVAEVYAVLDRC